MILEREIPRVETTSGQLRGYDVNIDIADFKNRAENITTLKLRKKHDLETMLGERFNVEISVTNYQIKNGQLHHSEFDEPFTERIKRGIQYRKERSSPDQVREQAELDGFIYLQSQIENAPVGTKLVVISPPGKEYKHNFFDVYEKSGEDKVTTSRYTSTLTLEEQFQLAQRMDASWQAAALANPNAIPKDADFLRHPLLTNLSKQDILSRFHPEEDTMTLQDYQSLTRAAAPLIRAYVNQLEEDPTPEKVHPLYSALLNFADKYHDNPEIRDVLSAKLSSGFKKYTQELSELPVRQVMAGCGLQAGFDTANGTTPYSVADYAMKDRFGKMDIQCGECGFSYLRNPGQLEEKCRKCGGTKGIAC